MIVTVVNVTTGKPFIDKATLVVNDDKSVSFQLPNGLFAGQEPSNGGYTYGVRYPDSAENKAYQRATLNGNTVTFLTRDVDNPYVYLLGQGQTYNA